jgi:hypothetical protein
MQILWYVVVLYRVSDLIPSLPLQSFSPAESLIPGKKQAHPLYLHQTWIKGLYPWRPPTAISGGMHRFGGSWDLKLPRYFEL